MEAELNQETEYVLEGYEDMGTIEQVYESYSGDYWVITDESNAHPFGYACLSSMPQFAEWGTINKDTINRKTVWPVDRINWEHTGPDQINIVEK